MCCLVHNDKIYDWREKKLQSWLLRNTNAMDLETSNNMNYLLLHLKWKQVQNCSVPHIINYMIWHFMHHTQWLVAYSPQTNGIYSLRVRTTCNEENGAFALPLPYLILTFEIQSFPPRRLFLLPHFPVCRSNWSDNLHLQRDDFQFSWYLFSAST